MAVDQRSVGILGSLRPCLDQNVIVRTTKHIVKNGLYDVRRSLSTPCVRRQVIAPFGHATRRPVSAYAATEVSARRPNFVSLP